MEGANLTRANLANANLKGARLSGANLVGAALVGVSLAGANLRGAKLAMADLSACDLRYADLEGADLSRAILAGADLRGARMIETNLAGASISDCRVYGASVWKVNLAGCTQRDLIINGEGEPCVTVDNLDVAQFIYLLLDNQRLRDIIDTITSKVVLVLGRFTPERKAVLDAVRKALRVQGYCPVVFDFERPASRDLTETISTLAHMARFIVVDLTDPRSVPHELAAVVPGLRSVPVVPVIEGQETEYAMFEDLEAYPWVLPIHRYQDLDDLVTCLPEKIIANAEAMANTLRARHSSAAPHGDRPGLRLTPPPP